MCREAWILLHSRPGSWLTMPAWPAGAWGSKQTPPPSAHSFAHCCWSRAADWLTCRCFLVAALGKVASALCIITNQPVPAGTGRKHGEQGTQRGNTTRCVMMHVVSDGDGDGLDARK